MNKAAQIRKLAAQGLSNAQIAQRVCTSKDYVRAARQRPDGKPSKADLNYMGYSREEQLEYYRSRHAKRRLSLSKEKENHPTS